MAKLAHVHKWKLDGDYSGGAWMSCECHATMDAGDMERRINAVEKFSLQDAIQILWNLEHAAGIVVGPEFDALEDYVVELEP